jgi:hypothetical protein
MKDLKGKCEPIKQFNVGIINSIKKLQGKAYIKSNNKTTEINIYSTAKTKYDLL